jgi:hypothetical protein
MLFCYTKIHAHIGHTPTTPFKKLKWEVFGHPDHSPDLVPFDFLMFRALKKAPKGRQFADDDDVKEAVNEWLRN